MKKLKYIPVLLLFLFNLSFYSTDGFTRLTETDILANSQTEPAIIRDDGMKSFMQWRCFAVQDFRLQCTKIGQYNPNGKDYFIDDPDEGEVTVTVMLAGKQYDFEDEDHDRDCPARIEAIKKIIDEQNTESICLRTSYLQDIDPKYELWSLFNLKIGNVYWPDAEL